MATRLKVKAPPGASEVKEDRRCPRCRGQVKTWDGDDARCAFPNGIFTSDNWNCATASALRQLDEAGVSYNDDQSTVLLHGGNACEAVVVTWYKNRGQTEGAWMLDGSRAPQPLTLKVAEQVLEAYEKTKLEAARAGQAEAIRKF